MYITNYITKCDRGMKIAMKNVQQAARDGRLSLGQLVRQMGNAHLNSQTISAIEAACIVLGLPMRRPFYKRKWSSGAHTARTSSLPM